MSTQTLYRWGALVTIVTAFLLAAAAIAVIVVPDGGLASPVAPALYYVSLILIVPAYMTLYAAQSQAAGKLGLAGFVMAVIGSIMYSGPAFILMAGTSGVATWHDVWGFAMGNILPVGASLFLIGSTLFGAASMRAKVYPPYAGLLLAIGSFLWLIVFYIPVPFLLSLANLLDAVALAWIGLSLLTHERISAVQAQQTA